MNKKSNTFYENYKWGNLCLNVHVVTMNNNYKILLVGMSTLPEIVNSFRIGAAPFHLGTVISLFLNGHNNILSIINSKNLKNNKSFVMGTYDFTNLQ